MSFLFPPPRPPPKKSQYEFILKLELYFGYLEKKGSNKLYDRNETQQATHFHGAKIVGSETFGSWGRGKFFHFVL